MVFWAVQILQARAKREERAGRDEMNLFDTTYYSVLQNMKFFENEPNAKFQPKRSQKIKNKRKNSKKGKNGKKGKKR